MVKKDTSKIPVDPLMFLYWNESTAVGNANAVSFDATDAFWDTIRSRLANGNLITIAIRGEPASGKSTVGLKIKQVINKTIVALGKNKNISEYDTICSDQIEFNRAIMKQEENVCYLIDEFSALGATAENSSVEQAMFEFFTDVAAQKFIHRIACNIKGGGIYQTTSTILLDVVGVDKVKKETWCMVYYRNPARRDYVMIGKVRIDVSDIIEKDWYQRYRKKKFLRIALLDKHGCRDVRELEFSDITLAIYKDLKGLAEGKEKIDNDIIEMKMREETQKRKLMFSIFGTALIQRPIRGLLALEHNISKYEAKLEKPRPKKEAEQLEKLLKMNKKALKEMIQHHEQNSKVLKEYNNIK